MQPTILLIDDDIFLTEAMGPVLSEHGFTVLVANDNDTALGLLRDHDDEIGLVVQDVMRPLGRCLDDNTPLRPPIQSSPELFAGLRFFQIYLAESVDKRPVVFYSVSCVNPAVVAWIKSYPHTYAVAKCGDPDELIRLIGTIADGGPVGATQAQEPGPAVIAHVRAISDELIAYLAKHPELMHELHPRKFEELVSRLLLGMGYEVELTPPTWDDGYDIRAVRNDELGPVIYIVECKRFRPDHPVDVGLVRQLCGAKQRTSAHIAVLATTSFFTSSARKYERDLGMELSLKDYEVLCGWLRGYGAKKP